MPEGVAIGDQVCVYPLVPCGECVACRKSHPNICRNRVAFGYQLPGGLSQYIVVPADARQNIVALPGVSAAEAALAEPPACALNGQNLAKVAGRRPSWSAGCGPLGLMHIRLAGRAPRGSRPLSRSTRTPPGTRSRARPAPTWCSLPATTPPPRSWPPPTAVSMS
ncbi:MAG: alcohol dehydrogenase catalytic domain-containing protein [Micropruina sp.]